MGVSARVLEVADLAVGAVKLRLPPDDATTVERAYLARIADPEFPDTIAGRKVYVFPAGYAQIEMASREKDENEYQLAVLIVERYADQGPPPDDWLDDRVQWVQERVWAVLGDARGEPVAGCWSQTGEVSVVFDAEFLRSHNLFWSECQFAFRAIE